MRFLAALILFVALAKGPGHKLAKFRQALRNGLAGLRRHDDAKPWRKPQALPLSYGKTAGPPPPSPLLARP